MLIHWCSFSIIEINEYGTPCIWACRDQIEALKGAVTSLLVKGIRNQDRHYNFLHGDGLALSHFLIPVFDGVEVLSQGFKDFKIRPKHKEV